MTNLLMQFNQFVLKVGSSSAYEMGIIPMQFNQFVLKVHIQ